MEETPIVQGPDDPEEGYIRDFMAESVDLEDLQYKEGDTFRVPISCPGYDVDRVRVETKRLPVPGYEGSLYTAIGARVPLRPKDTTSIGSSRTNDEIVITGLVTGAGSYEPLRFILSDTDPLSKYIDYDDQTGIITLLVAISYSDDDDMIRFAYDLNIQEKETSAFQESWNKHSKQDVKEGVVYMEEIIPDDLSCALNDQLSRLAKEEIVDWHPGSNNCVRDLVHPSLYPLIKGESPLTEFGEELLAQISKPLPLSEDTWKYENGVVKRTDRWGRPYEDSIYQWLPSIFRTEADGRVHIETYINNLDEEKYKELYRLLEKLFERFLPLFEQVYSYAQATNFITSDPDEEDYTDFDYSYEPELEQASLKGKQLLVITKIVEYVLRDEESTIDGVFHVEGMSSDHILATGTYTLHRDEGIEGGDLEFRRAFSLFEASYIHLNIPQCRHWKAEEIVEEGIRPLGNLATINKRGIVFPNSHIHRLTPIRCKPSYKNQTRRAIVFWLVDPDAKVLSTEHVPKQQNVSMSHERALWHRLQLMEERKKHKGKFNTHRKISLCEH